MTASRQSQPGMNCILTCPPVRKQTVWVYAAGCMVRPESKYIRECSLLCDRNGNACTVTRTARAARCRRSSPITACTRRTRTGERRVIGASGCVPASPIGSCRVGGRDMGDRITGYALHGNHKNMCVKRVT